MEEFDSNSEYTEIRYNSGLKQWIQNRYDFVCSYYPVKCTGHATDTTVIEEEPTNIETAIIEEEPTTFKTDIIEELTVKTDTEDKDNSCWSEALGYPCCTSCTVRLQDQDGLWDVEHKQWCGIINEICEIKYKECWSSYYGYS